MSKLIGINCHWIPLSTAFCTERLGVSIDCTVLSIHKTAQGFSPDLTQPLYLV